MMYTLSIQHAPLDGTLFSSARNRVTFDDFSPLWRGITMEGNVLTLRTLQAWRNPAEATLRIAIPANDNMAPLP